MRFPLFKSICRLLVVTMFFLSFQSAQAGMIGADQVASAHAGQADRAAVLAALSRSEISSQLQAMGIDPGLAKERVAAMTDEEVRSLAGKVNQLPAGADISGWGWVAIILVVAAIAYFIFGWKR